MAFQVLDIMTLLLPLFIILIGCELFTNGIEWLGVKLGLTESTTGSILAAVGTALPETVVPIMAIIFATGTGGSEIAEGAILGAPFMLATLAMLVGGVAIFVAHRRGRRAPTLNVSEEHVGLDIKSFLAAYSFAVIAGLFLQGSGDTARALRFLIAIFLFALYAIYVRKMLRQDSKKIGEPESLYFTRAFSEMRERAPSTFTVMVQVISSLGMIIIGAKIFVGGIETVSMELGVSNIILAFLIAPIATELPEKFNSVLWYWRGKDTLALGNITGAMVFQSSIPVSIGLLFTDWTLWPINILSMLLAMAAILLIYWEMRTFKSLSYKSLLLSGSFYVVFLLLLVLYPPPIA